MVDVNTATRVWACAAASESLQPWLSDQQSWSELTSNIVAQLLLCRARSNAPTFDSLQFYFNPSPPELGGPLPTSETGPLSVMIQQVALSSPITAGNKPLLLLSLLIHDSEYPGSPCRQEALSLPPPCHLNLIDGGLY